MYIKWLGSNMFYILHVLQFCFTLYIVSKCICSQLILSYIFYMLSFQILVFHACCLVSLDQKVDVDTRDRDDVSVIEVPQACPGAC